MTISFADSYPGGLAEKLVTQQCVQQNTIYAMKSQNISWPSLLYVRSSLKAEIIIVLVARSKGSSSYLLGVRLSAANLPIVLKRKTPVVTIAAMLRHVSTETKQDEIALAW